jgi:hypothetical protein
MGYEVQSASTERAPAGRPVLTIQPSGAVRANIEACKVLKELGAERVLLLWDKDRRKIGIAAAAKNDARSYKLRYDSDLRSAQFSAKATFKRLGWSADHSVRVPVHLSDKMLEGTLPAEHLTGAARARKKKPDL